MKKSIKIGARCKWNDPAIEDYDESDREEALNRVFIVFGINDDIIKISDGFSEVEVLENEIEII